MTTDEFRKAGHALVEWIAAYREGLACGGARERWRSVTVLYTMRENVQKGLAS